MEKVTYGNGLPGFEYGEKNLPAVIVVQEFWGVTDAIKELAIEISKIAGARVLIPDLYKGKIGVEREEAYHLYQNLDWKNAVVELKDAVNYLKSTGSSKVGITGFCMGGALAFAAAEHCGVDCAAPFYGSPKPEMEICDVTQIRVPVQGHFGALDKAAGFSDPETARAVEAKMKAAGAPIEIFIYSECGHGFMNVLTPAGKLLNEKAGHHDASESQAQEALATMAAFFKRHLT